MNKTLTTYTILSILACACAAPAFAAPQRGREASHHRQQPQKHLRAPAPQHHRAPAKPIIAPAHIPSAGINLAVSLGKHAGLTITLPVAAPQPVGQWVNRETQVWVEGYWTETRTAGGILVNRARTEGYWKTVIEPEWVVVYNR